MDIKNKIKNENLFEKLKVEAQKFSTLYYDKNIINAQNTYNYVKYLYSICPYLMLLGYQKQEIIEIDNLYDRMSKVIDILTNKNQEVIKSARNYNKKKSPITYSLINSNKTQNKKNKVDELEEKINSANMSEEAKQIALEELEKLRNASSTESEWIYNYLNTLVSLPWNKVTVDSDNLAKSKEILERDHFGLDKVKKRIIEYLAVRKLNKDNNKGSIICFNGPPGVGKTSLAKSIAEALNKKFYRLSLGGIRDESEIRGHRKTYISSMPGAIIQAIKRVESKNPVLLLDEIDKVGQSHKGDVSAALLELLDPEQNHTFKDHYINTPFDLSKVFFICTSNYIENISLPLRDRLEIIDISGYTVTEKLQIAKKYLIPKQMNEKGILKADQKINVILSDETLQEIIIDYTYESGVRQLERNIAAICRYIARLYIEALEKGENGFKEITINSDILHEVLGRKMIELDLDLRTSNPGVAIGLAYTMNGGALTLIESVSFQGKGELIVTGNLGDVMKESINTGLSWIKSNANELNLTDVDFKTLSLHVHVPSAAVPKDGPSAGITITTSILSMLKGVPVRKDTAMTGEISLQGYVLPVGGIKEKCLAAYRNNIKRIILSYKNQKDVKDLPKEIKENIQ